jgi:chromosome segregation ATPase
MQMATKKLTAKKTKSKPAQKPAKKKLLSPPKANLDSIQLTLNKVVDKLGQHDQQFEKISQKFLKIDERFDGIDHRLNALGESFHKQGIIQEKMQGETKLIAEGFDALDSKIDAVEKRLAESIDNGVADLKVAISSLANKYGHEVPFPSKSNTPA